MKKKKKHVKLIGQMFIDPGKVKRVEVNNENIQYYNSLYEEMRSEEAKINMALEAERLKAMQPTWLQRVFCYKKPITQADVDVYEEIVYSSGDSGDEENRLGRIYLKMKEKQKDTHIR